MAVYRFKVSFESLDFISRDIDIRSDQTFYDLFLAIQHAIGFDTIQHVSFYISNDNWTLGQEISTADKGSNSIRMHDAALADWVNDPHQKIFYIYDFTANWSFQIELIKIMIREEPGRTYPFCSGVSGAAPKQYVIQPSPKHHHPDEKDRLNLVEEEDPGTVPEDDFGEDSYDEQDNTSFNEDDEDEDDTSDSEPDHEETEGYEEGQQEY